MAVNDLNCHRKSSQTLHKEQNNQVIYYSLGNILCKNRAKTAVISGNLFIYTKIFPAIWTYEVLEKYAPKTKPKQQTSENGRNYSSAMDHGGVCDYFDESASRFDFCRKYWKKYGTRAARSGNTWGSSPDSNRNQNRGAWVWTQQIFQQRRHSHAPSCV